MGSVCQHLKCPFPFDLAQFHLSHVHRDTALSVMPPRGKISYSMIRKSPPSKRDNMDSMTPLIWKQARHPREPLSTTAVPRVTHGTWGFLPAGRQLWGQSALRLSGLHGLPNNPVCHLHPILLPYGISNSILHRLPLISMHNSTVTCN